MHFDLIMIATEMVMKVDEEAVCTLVNILKRLGNMVFTDNYFPQIVAGKSNMDCPLPLTTHTSNKSNTNKLVSKYENSFQPYSYQHLVCKETTGRSSFSSTRNGSL